MSIFLIINVHLNFIQLLHNLEDNPKQTFEKYLVTLILIIGLLKLLHWRQEIISF